MTPREGVPVLLDRADVLKALRDTLNVTDNRVTQAFGKPWLDDAASRIMAIQPVAHPAATAREEAWKALLAYAECEAVWNNGALTIPEACQHLFKYGFDVVGRTDTRPVADRAVRFIASLRTRALALARSVKDKEV